MLLDPRYVFFDGKKLADFGDTLLVANHCPMTVADQFSSFKEFSQLKLLTQLHTLMVDDSCLDQLWRKRR